MNTINLHLAHLHCIKQEIPKHNSRKLLAYTCLNVKYLEIRLKKLRATKLVNADKINRYRTVKNPGLRTTCIHYAASFLAVVTEVMAHLLWRFWRKETDFPLTRLFAGGIYSDASILVSCDCVKDHARDDVIIAVRTFGSSSAFGLLVTCTFYYMD